MKNVILSAGLVLVIIFSIVISLTILSNTSRQNEVEAALTAAVEQTLANLKIDKKYPIDSEKELVADFTQRLIVGLNSDSEIIVNILAVDMKKGLLDVEVVEKYRQPNGKDGTASYRKTVILEEIYVDKTEYQIVTFMVENGYSSGSFKTYKTFTLVSGENVIFPGAEPQLDGYEFVGWSTDAPSAENNYRPELVDSMVADSELTFYAVFEQTP